MIRVRWSKLGSCTRASKIVISLTWLLMRYERNVKTYKQVDILGYQKLESRVYIHFLLRTEVYWHNQAIYAKNILLE